MATIASELGRRVENNHGNYYVTVDVAPGEHHSTNRADARRFLRSALGESWEICAYLGPVHYRNGDGYPTTAKRYSAVRIGVES